MKKCLAVLFGVIMLAASASAANNLAVYLSHWNASDLDDGFGPAVKGSLDLIPELRLELRASYIAEFDSLKQDISVFPLEIDIAKDFVVSDVLTTYVGLGLGYYMADGEQNTTGGTADAETGDEVGYFIVAGAELLMDDTWGFFGELKYTMVTLDNAAIDGTKTRDVDLDGPGVQLGVFFPW